MKPLPLLLMVLCWFLAVLLLAPALLVDVDEMERAGVE